MEVQGIIKKQRVKQWAKSQTSEKLKYRQLQITAESKV